MIIKEMETYQRADKNLLVRSINNKDQNRYIVMS